MDVNGTRFHLIQGAADWQKCLGDGAQYPWLSLALDAGQSVSLSRLLPILPPPRVGGPLDPSQRRGAAIDGLGHAYWIGSDEQSLLWLPAGTRRVLQLWPRPHPAAAPPAAGFAPVTPPIPQSLTLRGLTVTTHNYLVAGIAAPAGLLIFDLTSGAPPSLLLLPEGIPFAPFDIAPSAEGGFWVLDRINRTYWGFDRDFRAQAHAEAVAGGPPVFQPVEGSPAVVPPLPVPAVFPIAVPDPIAIDELPDRTVVILDGSASEGTASLLYRYRLGATVGGPVPLEGQADVRDGSTGGVSRRTLSVVAHDIAYSTATGLLYAVDQFGRQSLAFEPDVQTTALTLQLQSIYLPMHRHGGRALVAWNGTGSTAVSYDVVGKIGGDDSFVRWARLRAIDQEAYARSAVLETPVLDGKARDCAWDSLFLDACIPPGASVSVSSCADNDPDLVTNGPFNPEPRLYLRRGEAEIPFYDPYAACDPKPEGAGTWELLLQQARGRYLKLRLEIAGDGRASPKLKALRVYYPRFSYPRHYLPAAYLDDPVSASFVERLLANPKGFYSDIEAKIAHVGYLFDPRSAPTDALDWLAGWLGLALDPLWQDVNQRLQPASNGNATATPAAADRRRLFIRFATRLFTRRGTADGIRFGLHLLLEPCLEGLLRRMQLAALIRDPALSEELERLGLASRVGAWGVLEGLARTLFDPAMLPPDDLIWVALATLSGRGGVRLGTGVPRSVSYHLPESWAAQLPSDDSAPAAWAARDNRLRLWSRGGFMLSEEPACATGMAADRAAAGYGAAHRPARSPFGDAPLAVVGDTIASGFRHWLSLAVPFLRVRLERALRLDPAETVSHTLLRRRGRLYVTTTHVDLVMSLDQVSLPARMAGLDRSPGWLGAFGRVILFHFE